MVNSNNRIGRIDNIVVLILEKCSFDNILGWLHAPENKARFDKTKKCGPENDTRPPYIIIDTGSPTNVPYEEELIYKVYDLCRLTSESSGKLSARRSLRLNSDIGGQLMTSQTVGSYTYVNDLWIITSYFNSHGYETKLRNYELFVERIERSRLNLLVVECAFGNTPFALRRSPNVLQVRGKDIMWQKERLLNIAIKQLPDSCEKVAWVDCDILFENADWVIQTSALLDQVPVVQPFDKAVRLPMGRLFYDDRDKFFAGFCALQQHLKDLTAGRVTSAAAAHRAVAETSAFQMVYCGVCGGRIAAADPFCPCRSARVHPPLGTNLAMNTTHPERPRLGDFEKHGHTGFAWAARKDLLINHGLYDVSLSGTGDHLMAHAMCGDWDVPCIQRLIGENERHLDYFLAWGERVYGDVGGNVAYVEGTISHLWHGDDADRNYKNRGWELARLSFDPVTDLRLGDNGCWEWNSDKPDLHQWAIDYFGLRKEDGYGLVNDLTSQASWQSSVSTERMNRSRQGSRGKGC